MEIAKLFNSNESGVCLLSDKELERCYTQVWSIVYDGIPDEGQFTSLTPNEGRMCEGFRAWLQRVETRSDLDLEPLIPVGHPGLFVIHNLNNGRSLAFISDDFGS